MTKQERIEKYAKRLEEIREEGDEEYGHMAADKALCDLLEELGYKGVVEEFRYIRRFFI